jgi:hypothetical protein
MLATIARLISRMMVVVFKRNGIWKSREIPLTCRLLRIDLTHAETNNMNPTCPSCGSTDTDPVDAPYDYKCCDCGEVFTASEYHDEDYGQDR